MIQGVNLIPAPHRLHHQRKRRIRGWVFGGSIYFCLLAAVWSFARVSWGGGAALAGQLSQTERRIERTEQSIESLRPRWQRVRATLAASRGISEQPDWSLLLSLLAGQLADDAALTRCQLEPAEDGGYRLHLAGLAGSMEAVSDYLLELERLGLFDRVQLLDTSRRPSSGRPLLSFRIECLLRGGEGS
ncbi:MAG: PilN domain-containing protein [Phycisphaeraceae bacterium]